MIFNFMSIFINVFTCLTYFFFNFPFLSKNSVLNCFGAGLAQFVMSQNNLHAFGASIFDMQIITG